MLPFRELILATIEGRMPFRSISANEPLLILLLVCAGHRQIDTQRGRQLLLVVNLCSTWNRKSFLKSKEWMLRAIVNYQRLLLCSHFVLSGEIPNAGGRNKWNGSGDDRFVYWAAEGVSLIKVLFLLFDFQLHEMVEHFFQDRKTIIICVNSASRRVSAVRLLLSHFVSTVENPCFTSFPPTL